METLKRAIEMTAVRRAAAPNFQILESIQNQLAYLQQVVSGESLDKRRLKEIVIGVYAVKEFDESDPEFATLLKEAQLIANKMSKGLKV